MIITFCNNVFTFCIKIIIVVHVTNIFRNIDECNIDHLYTFSLHTDRQISVTFKSLDNNSNLNIISMLRMMLLSLK